LGLIQACGTERIDDILLRPTCAKHAARWLVRAGVLDQFRVAAEIATEDIRGYKAFPAAESGRKEREIGDREGYIMNAKTSGEDHINGISHVLLRL
jgi:hypothetical protein